MQTNASNATLSNRPKKQYTPRRVYTLEFRESHPNRCQFVRLGKRCLQFRWTNPTTGELTPYCFYHKRNHALHDKPREVDMGRLRYYQGRMGPKLSEFVEQCISQPESDQYDLSQELAIARDLTGEAIELYEKAKLLPDNNPHKGQRLATAGALMASAMKEVRETCRIGSEAFNNAKDKYSVHTLVDVVSQIKKMIRACFDYDQSGLQRFDQMLNDRLRLPKIGADGTTITPDSDVMQMDDSVPRCIAESVVDSTATELLLLSCPQCNGQFNHPDLNCVCPECNVALREVAA